MARYVANGKISGPIGSAKPPDVDLGGVMWSYKTGLVYPAAAAVSIPLRLPSPFPSENPIGKGRTQ